MFGYNPRKRMNSEFRSFLLDEITRLCTLETNPFFSLIRCKVETGYNLFDFLNVYSEVKQSFHSTSELSKMERSELQEFFMKSNKSEHEAYLIMLSIDLPNFVIEGNWQYSEIDITSRYPYVLVFASELNKRLSDETAIMSAFIDDMKPLIRFYKKEREKEYFLEHFNSIDWYTTRTIMLSREYLGYSKVNSKHIFGKYKEKNYIDSGDIIVTQDDMLTILLSRVRELFLTKTNKKHSSAFSYIIKKTHYIGSRISKRQFINGLNEIHNIFKDDLKMFAIKRNKENFHITIFKPKIVFKNNTFQSETTIDIPKIYEILDSFVSLYEKYRETVIGVLSLSRQLLPRRAKIQKSKLGDLYIKYTY